MAWSDAEGVAAAMRVLLGGTGLTFVPAEAEDESVDADVQVLLHGHPTDYAIQVGGGYICLNQYLYRGEGRTPLDLVAARHHGNYGNTREDMRELATELQQQLLFPATA